MSPVPQVLETKASEAETNLSLPSNNLVSSNDKLGVMKRASEPQKRTSRIGMGSKQVGLPEELATLKAQYAKSLD